VVNDIRVSGGDNGSGRTGIDFRFNDRALTLDFVFQPISVFEGKAAEREGKLVPKLVPSAYNIDTTQPTIIMHYPFRICTRWTRPCALISNLKCRSYGRKSFFPLIPLILSGFASSP